jgi:preprotein translocase, YajC subunit
MKRIAGVLVMIAIFASLALTGCMPMGGGNIEAGGTTDSTNGLMSFLPLILIIAVFYFVLIRPQNKKNKQVQQMRDAIKRGDWVTTIGGFRGRVLRVKDDAITIEVGSDKVKLEIMRWGISKIEDGSPASKSTTQEKEEEETEQPKRKPKKLEPVAKKVEPAEEDLTEEETDDEVYEDEPLDDVIEDETIEEETEQDEE